MKSLFRILLLAVLSLMMDAPLPAQIPFEKKSKWGLRDSVSNKVTVKPQYNSLASIPGSENFLVSMVTKDGEQYFGLINSFGNIIAPISAHSISRFHDFLIWHGRELPLNEEKSKKKSKHPIPIRQRPLTRIYDLSGKMVFNELGKIKEFFSDVFIFDSEHNPEEPGHDFICDSKLNRISLENKGILQITPKAIIMEEYDEMARPDFIPRRRRLNGYAIYPISNFKQPVFFRDYREIFRNTWLFKPDSKYTIVNIKTGDITPTVFSNCSKDDNCSFPGEDRIILYNKADGSAMAISSDGNMEYGKACTEIGSSTFYRMEFLPRGKNGGLNIGGYECDDAIPYDLLSKYSVKVGDKWGFYDANKKELVIPAKLPAPVEKTIAESPFVQVEGSKDLYDYSGECICSLDNENIADIRDGLMYIGGYWAPEGVYSIPMKEWILPVGKYDRLHKLGDETFTATLDGTIYIIDSKGQVLNTLKDISEINYLDDDYFIRVIGTNGKMGIIDKDNGQWIVKCLYDNDIVWGSGEGLNRRFILAKSNDSGETLVVMTVGGKTIASKFFPYGSSKLSIEIFANKYLFQTYM